MNQQAAPEAVIKAPPTFWRRHWRLLVGVAVFVVIVLIYIYVAITALPQWLVSITAGKADANTELNAVTTTRAALLGIVTPVALVVGGIAAFLNYQETVDQNRRINGRARIERAQARRERDEVRRVRRAEVYAEFLSAVHGSLTSAYILYSSDPQSAETARHVMTNLEKRLAMDLSTDRVMLLGSDTVRIDALLLSFYCGTQIATKAGEVPRLSLEEFKRLSGDEYNKRHMAFLEAARKDLAPTR